MAYTGALKNLLYCPHCQFPRFDSKGAARKTYWTIPLAPRLKAWFKNPERARLLRRDLSHSPVPGHLSSVFDGQLFKDLSQRCVEPDRQTRPRVILEHGLFSDPRDQALGMSTDGISVHRRGTKEV